MRSCCILLWATIIVLLLGLVHACPLTSAPQFQYNFAAQVSRASQYIQNGFFSRSLLLTFYLLFIWNCWLGRAVGELFEKWQRTSGHFASYQSMLSTSSSDTIRIEVCYLPPFEWNPTLPRARELLSVIRDSSSFKELYTFQPTLGCFTTPTSTKECLALQIVPSTSCLDAQLFVDATRLEFELNSVLSLSGEDNGVVWSQISSQFDSILSSLNVAIQMGDNPNAKAALLENISTRGSDLRTLLTSLFASNYGSLGRYSNHSADNLAYWRALTAEQGSQIIAAFLSSNTLLPLTSFSALRAFDDRWRAIVQFIPTIGLRVIGSAMYNLTLEASFVSDLTPYIPSQIFDLIDSLVLDYYALARSALSGWSAPSFGQSHRDCYALKLDNALYRYNFSALLSGYNNAICSSTKMAQEYGLFSSNPSDDCFSALLNDNLTQADSTLSTVVIDFLNVEDSNHVSNETLSFLDLNEKFKFTAFKRISSSTTALLAGNSSLLGHTVDSVPVLRGNLQWKFNTSITFDTSLTLTQSRRNWQIHPQLDSRSSFSGGSKVRWNSERDTIPPCTPGYYSKFDSTAFIYTCTDCPLASYCLGTDGLQRLCANGPIGRSTYTSTTWATASCPFNCTVQGECRTGDACVVPPVGSQCQGGQVSTCPSASAPQLWSFTSLCSASLRYLGYLSVPTEAAGCANYKTCKFISKPTSNFALFFTLQLGEIPQTSATNIIFYSAGQYTVSLVLNTDLQAQLLVQLISATNVLATVFLSPTFYLDVGIPVDFGIVSSESNYLMLFINDEPQYYGFFDASSAPASNSGSLLFAPYSTSAPLMALSNVIFTDLNETIYARNARDTPSSLRRFFCDLSTSTIDADGNCLSPCPSGHVRTSLSNGLSVCLCSSADNCFDRSYSSSSACLSSTFFSWSGSYLVIEVVSGSAYMSSLGFFDDSGNLTTFADCSPIQPSYNFWCLEALSSITSTGWPLTKGTTGFFYLPRVFGRSSSISPTMSGSTGFERDSQSVISAITRIIFKLRAYTFDSSIVLNVYLPSTASDIRAKSPSTLIAKNWNLKVQPFGTSLANERLETIDPAKASWLAKATGSFSRSWDSSTMSTCLACPSGSSISLPPLLSVRDCVCSNGVVPDASTGCQARSDSSLVANARSTLSCTDLLGSVTPTLPAGTYSPLTLFGFQSSLRNDSQGFLLSNNDPWSGALYAELSIVVTGQASTQHLTISVGDLIPLSASSNVTYTVSVPGCSVSASYSLQYLILPSCSTPTIAVGGNSAQTLISIWGASNTALEYFVNSGINVDTSNIPWLNYSLPFEVTSSCLVYARAVPNDGTCSTSIFTYSSVRVDSPSPNPSPTSSSKSCGDGCIAVITVCSILAVLAVAFVITVFLFVKGKLSFKSKS